MATLRDILRKIAAVKKTGQITRAMNMVAAAKLRSVQVKMESFEPYATKFSEVLGNLASRIEPDIHPLLLKKEHVSRIELLHFTADRGLCGGFNTNSINTAEKWIKDQQTKGIDCSLTIVGKKGWDYFRKRGIEPPKVYICPKGRPKFDIKKKEIYLIPGCDVEKLLKGYELSLIHI